MKKLIVISMMVFGAVLEGCASTPRSKPEMDEQTLLGSAANWVLLQRCGAQGDMSPELTAEGIRIFQIKASQYSYSNAQMNQHIQTLSTKYPQVSREDCNKMAINVAGLSQQLARNNRESDAIIAENERAMRINQPVNTYCNKIGSQTFCRTQ